MKKLVGIIAFSTLSILTFAQGELKFEEESYDFGVIKEGDVADHSFKFKNIGNEPVIISNVKASCGCTTPYWPKNPIPPGGSGEIKASYNSKGRPGGFVKSITVTSNAKTQNSILKINGNATAAPSEVYSPEEIANSPHIQLIDREHNFGTVILGQEVSKKFRIKNTGKSDLEVRNLNSGCNCITYSLEKSPLKPNEETTITIIYRPRSLGQRNEVINVFTNDITNPLNVIMGIKANVVNNTDNKSIINKDDKFTF